MKKVKPLVFRISSNLKKPKKLALLFSILLIVLALPLTVMVIQQHTQTKQSATTFCKGTCQKCTPGPNCVQTDDCTALGPGNYCSGSSANVCPAGENCTTAYDCSNSGGTPDVPCANGSSAVICCKPPKPTAPPGVPVKWSCDTNVHFCKQDPNGTETSQVTCDQKCTANQQPPPSNQPTAVQAKWKFPDPAGCILPGSFCVQDNINGTYTSQALCDQQCSAKAAPGIPAPGSISCDNGAGACFTQSCPDPSYPIPKGPDTCNNDPAKNITNKYPGTGECCSKINNTSGNSNNPCANVISNNPQCGLTQGGTGVFCGNNPACIAGGAQGVLYTCQCSQNVCKTISAIQCNNSDCRVAIGANNPDYCGSGNGPSGTGGSGTCSPQNPNGSCPSGGQTCQNGSCQGTSGGITYTCQQGVCKGSDGSTDSRAKCGGGCYFCDINANNKCSPVPDGTTGKLPAGCNNTCNQSGGTNTTKCQCTGQSTYTCTNPNGTTNSGTCVNSRCDPLMPGILPCDYTCDIQGTNHFSPPDPKGNSYCTSNQDCPFGKRGSTPPCVARSCSCQGLAAGCYDAGHWPVYTGTKFANGYCMDGSSGKIPNGCFLKMRACGGWGGGGLKDNLCCDSAIVSQATLNVRATALGIGTNGGAQLPGIGIAYAQGSGTPNTPNPLHMQKTMVITGYTSLGQGYLTSAKVLGTAAFTATDTITYDPASGNFINPYFKLGKVQGNYQLIAHVDGYLDAQVTYSGGNSVFTLSPGKGAASDVIQLIPGDIGPGTHGDNFIDIIDYNKLISCLSKSPTGACKLADLNDDGVIDQKDLDLLFGHFGSLGFSIDTPEFTCVIDPACTSGQGTLQMCQLICTRQTGGY